MADGETVVEALHSRFGDGVIATGSFRSQHWAEVRPERLLEICGWLRDDRANEYNVLTDVTAAHWPDRPSPIELIYHLYSVSRNDRLRLKVRTGDKGPVPSLTGLWPSANWNERETFDMFGIEFSGHPDLRRILMPDDYTDFPLRKEFPLYRG